MNGRAEDLAPVARTQGLVVRELDGEVLIYDRERDQAHCLNSVTASIWNLCDGGTTVAVMADMLQIDKYSIFQALSELGKLDLLQERVAAPSGAISRRGMLKRTGAFAAGAVAIPVITSLTLPSNAALAAGTCVATDPCPSGSPNLTGLHQGCPCTVSTQCCGNGGGKPGCCYTANGTTGGTCGICSTGTTAGVSCCQPGGTGPACGAVTQTCVE